MATETEHKYLVKKELWEKVVPDKSVLIRQAYMVTDPEKVIRLRTKGDKAFITIKGKAQGASRPEFEYEIPFADAMELIRDFCSALVEKTRHYVTYENKLWEVDEFAGLNAGLFVAEIELRDEDEKYPIPGWVSENVTMDHRYANSNLAVHPYNTWKK